MYVTTVPNRTSPPAILLRESYRVGDKVKTRTLANLTSWPAEKIETLKRVLKDERLVSIDEAFELVRSLPHGHVAAAYGLAKKLKLDHLIHTRSSRQRDLVLAMVVSRILQPRSKLGTVRQLSDETATSSLGELLGLGEVKADEVYQALDWLLTRQASIEKKLAKRHLSEGSLVLYDLTSTWLEGRCCPLGKHGYSRDKKRGKLQVEFGLLCESEGRPVAVEVFDGNMGDPSTLASQIEKIRERFSLKKVTLVGDRGMITEARIREELRPASLDWITSLRSPQIRSLVEGGALQLSLFDEVDLAEIQHPDYPNERLVACRNPLLAAERTRKREALLRQEPRRQLVRGSLVMVHGIPGRRARIRVAVCQV